MSVSRGTGLYRVKTEASARKRLEGREEEEEEGEEGGGGGGGVA